MIINLDEQNLYDHITELDLETCIQEINRKDSVRLRPMDE